MSLSGSRGRLAATTNELLNQWMETKNYWRDAKSHEFQKRYMDELFVGVDRAVTVIEKLDELLKRVKADCE